MTELQFISFLLYMPLPAVPSSGWRCRDALLCRLPAPAGIQNYPPSQGFISAQATGTLHGAPSLALGPAITSPCLELGPTIASPGPRHLLHLHPLVGPLLSPVLCLFPSSLSTNLVTRHNCFKLRHFFILASKASQPDFALIACLTQHLLSCHRVSVSEHLGRGHNKGHLVRYGTLRHLSRFRRGPHTSSEALVTCGPGQSLPTEGNLRTGKRASLEVWESQGCPFQRSARRPFWHYCGA